MEQIALCNTQVVILSDLNLQLVTPSSSATTFRRILEQFWADTTCVGSYA